MHERSKQVTRISGFPDAIRAAEYLEQFVRPVSDDVALLASAENLPDELKKRFQKKQSTVSRYRKSMANLAEAERLHSPPLLPERLNLRRNNN